MVCFALCYLRIMAFSLLCLFTPDLFSPWLVRPLADSPPVEYTCDSLLRLVFVFQFTERQQVSKGQTTDDNHSNSSTVTWVRSAKNTHYFITVTRWWYVCKPHHRLHSDHAKCVWIKRTLCVNVKLPLKWIFTGILRFRPNNRLTNA